MGHYTGVSESILSGLRLRNVRDSGVLQSNYDQPLFSGFLDSVTVCISARCVHLQVSEQPCTGPRMKQGQSDGMSLAKQSI